MIGRTEQLRTVRAAIERTLRAEDGPLVLFVTGEAGIGKTTLLNAARSEWVQHAEALTIAWADCSTPLIGQDIGEVEALAPWIAVMNQLAGDETQDQFRSRELIKDLAMAWMHCIPVVGDVLESVADTAMLLRRQSEKKRNASPGNYAANQDQVFQQYINFLGSLSERTPLVLVLDDFHWADTSSSNLLFAAARQLQGRPILFVVAYRRDDAASSRGGEGHPILHIRNELERYGLATEITIPRFTSLELDALLRSRYRSYVNNDAFEEWLARVGGGNALFITQFLETLEEDGTIDLETGELGRDFANVDVPQSAYAVIKERIRRLNEETRELLRYASVEGETFTSRVLASVAELPQLKLLQKLRLAEEIHRVVVSLGKQRVYARETSAFQFSHGLMQRVLYDSLGQEERELVHEAVLDALKEEWREAVDDGDVPGGMAARMAVHAMALGDDLLAAELLIEGATASWIEYSGEETLRQIETARAAIERFRSSADASTQRARSRVARADALEARALMLRGEVEAMRGHFGDALERFATARAHFERIDDAAAAVDAMVRQADMLYMREDRQEAESVAREALDSAVAHTHRRGEAAAARVVGKTLSAAGRYREAREMFEHALHAAEAAGSDADAALALDSIGIVIEILGDRADAQQYYQRALEICRRSGNLRGEAFAANSMGTLFLRLHDYQQARPWFERGRETFRAVGDREGEARTLNNLGLIAQTGDDLDAALDLYDQALEYYRETDSNYGEAMVLTNVAQIHYDRGDRDRGIELFRHCIDLFREVGDLRGEGSACYGLGTYLLEQGHYDEARELLERTRDIGREVGLKEMEALALGTLGSLEKSLCEIGDTDDRDAHRRRALDLFDQCIRIHEDMHSDDVAVWREARDQLES